MTVTGKRLNILLTRCQNIGDMLVFIPALRALRQALPAARITLLAKHAGGVEIIRACPYIDELLVVGDKSLGEKLRLLRAFRARAFDYFIISPQDLGKVPWAWLGGAKKIAGYKRVCNYGVWKKEKLPWLLDIAPLFDITRSEVEHCLRLVEDVLDDLGLELPANVDTRVEYSWQSATDTQRAQELLARYGIASGTRFVAVAPVSKRPAKNWPLERYAEVIRRMQAAWSVPVVFLGGAAERDELSRLAALAGGACHSLAGEATLAETAVVLQRAALCGGSDWGPTFLASAVGTPVIVLYGPADFYRWSLPAARAARIALFHPAPCNPCRHQVCPLSPRCMDAISIEEVWQACQSAWTKA